MPSLAQSVIAVEEAMHEAVFSNGNELGKVLAPSLKSKGKRLRPSLVFAIASSMNEKSNDKSIQAAAALELVHIASLVHDDIIDEATVRWNKPTVSAQAGSSIALLAGDYLFAVSQQLAGRVDPKVAVCLAEAFMRICQGESLELKTQYDTSRTIESYLCVVNDKTASMIEAACRIGTLCAGLDKAQSARLVTFGHHFGMMFQFLDDILDFISSEKLLGKPVGNDVKEGTYTLPVLLALKGTDAKRIQIILNNRQETNVEQLTKILIDGGYILSSLDLVKSHMKKAIGAANLLPQDTKAHVIDLPQTYFDWCLDALIASQYKKVVQPE